MRDRAERIAKIACVVIGVGVIVHLALAILRSNPLELTCH